MGKNSRKTRPPMEYGDLAVGMAYEIEYTDKDYPCDCICHDPSNNIIHCVACCVDKSYSGSGTLAFKAPPYLAFLLRPAFFVVIQIDGVRRKNPDQSKAIKVEKYMQNYLLKILTGEANDS